MTYPYSFHTTPSGWTCGKCGAYVPNGTYHGCTDSGGSGTNAAWQPTPIMNIMVDNALLERIAKALERIADNLDNIYPCTDPVS
jgi:hypothetical protein